MIIRLANPEDENKISILIARFRIELKGLKGMESDIMYMLAEKLFLTPVLRVIYRWNRGNGSFS